MWETFYRLATLASPCCQQRLATAQFRPNRTLFRACPASGILDDVSLDYVKNGRIFRDSAVSSRRD
ncbi:hypothetical protein ASC95_17985 [Pelomonas sp. Root1217]|nr:hypothetical protein ASC95_17985 [Pelomonas sp. Root1217]